LRSRRIRLRSHSRRRERLSPQGRAAGRARRRDPRRRERERTARADNRRTASPSLLRSGRRTTDGYGSGRIADRPRSGDPPTPRQRPFQRRNRRNTRRQRDHSEDARLESPAKTRRSRPGPGRHRRLRRRCRSAEAALTVGSRSIGCVDTPLWLDEPSRPVDSRSQDEVDVVVIGAGITGVSCALALARSGLRVRVHDVRGIAEGASGRNGGFALRGGAARYDVARETYGTEPAKQLWRRTEAAFDRLEAVAGDAFRRTGSLRLAANDEERHEIRLEYEALREDGFGAEWRDELPHLRPEFRGAIF